MNNNDYIFLKYIEKYYTNDILVLLITKHEKGISLLKRKQIQEFINSQPELTNPKELLFIYIIFKRTRANNYVDELGKQLFNTIGKVSKKTLFQWYAELQKVLKNLNLPNLEVSKQVKNNINFYYE